MKDYDGSRNSVKVINQALAIASADLRFKVLDTYRSCLREELQKVKIRGSHRKEMDLLLTTKDSGFSHDESFIRILVSSESEPVLHYIWRDSKWVLDESLWRVGHERRFIGKKLLTVNALKDTICDDKGLPRSSDSGMRAYIERVCKSLEFYGLIVRSRKSTHKKPFRGTKRLHTTMMNVNAAVAPLFAGRGD